MKKMLLLSVVLCIVAGAAYAAEPVKIGLMCPLTGSWASEGQDMKQIVELLADEVNAAGGVLGQQIEIITEDDGGDPRTAALAAQRLATQGIVAVIGTYGSSVTEASQNIFDESKIIQVANGST
ncbi:MAG: ABC transporter substrate-binding protein, partial [Desulfobacterales bacterium]